MLNKFQMKFFSFLFLMFFSCFGFASTTPVMETLRQEYLSAVRDAHDYALPSANLVSLKEGQVAEMVTWSAHSYAEGDQVLNHEVWVVTAHEMRGHCPELLKQADPEATDLRVNQLLGMPPSPDDSSRFVIIKVPVAPYIFLKANADASPELSKPQLQAQIIRPCFSSGDVSTSGCRYPDPKTFSKGVFESAVPTLSPYQEWIEGIKAETDDYPWTGLGYTYDWNPDNASHVGLSEFILPLGSSVDVEKVVSVQEFCESDLNDSSSPASSAQ